MNKTVKILKIETLTPDVKKFVVEKPKGYYFKIGNSVMLSINKPGWVDQKRPFTFTSLPEEKNLEFIIKSYPEHDGVTKMLHELEAGDELILGTPFQSIVYKGPGVFFAGGTGIAGFIAIFKRLTKKEISQCQLLYSAKTKKDIIMEKWLRKLFKNVANGLIITLTREYRPNYQKGRIDLAFIEKWMNKKSRNFYVCGPPAFVNNIKEALKNVRKNQKIKVRALSQS